jgi:hypothetical protein
VGNSYGTIENCYVAGSVTGGNCTGGLAGYSASSNCYAVGNVMGGQDTGGLVGDNTGVMEYRRHSQPHRRISGGIIMKMPLLLIVMLLLIASLRTPAA